MDSFEGIREFVAVADTQGFSSAARQLGCSSSHVSRQLARLESRLGCALLARTTRSVSLTKEGALYYQQCKDLVLGLALANEQLASQQYALDGTLRVSLAGSFAEEYVAPALIEFVNQHPGLNLFIDFDSRVIDFAAAGFDFVIRYGQLADSGLVARKLVNRSMMAVGSHLYLKENGAPSHPTQLKKHQCIVTNNRHWNFRINDELSSIKVGGRFECNNASVAVLACQQGMGIAYLPKTNFSNLLENEKLIPVLEEYWNKDISSWVVYQNRRFLPLRARLAIEYLLDYFSDWVE